MSMTQLLFSFEGRLNRKPWWLTNIAVGVGVTVLLLLGLAMVGEHKFTEAFLTMALLIILYIPLLWVSLALGAKRLHDRDKSAWWLALIYLGPGIASGIGDQMDSMGFVLHLVAFAITVWAFVELGCLRGTLGPTGTVPTHWGPSPSGRPAFPGPHVDAAMPRPLKPPR
jgi:uncharacterized membrane protein YhaH (DUF805 family)